VCDLTVRTEDEFDKFFKELEELRQRQPLISLWYRGQPGEYLLPNREELISQGIAQYSNVRDPSLVPSMYRPDHLREYSRTEESYERFCRIVAEWVRRANTLLGPSFELLMNERPVSAATYELLDDARVVMKLVYPEGGLHPRQSSDQGVPCLITWWVLDNQDRPVATIYQRHSAGWSSVKRSLLLQHYGCPTAALDVTRNPRVAAWFALHRLEGKHGLLAASPVEWPRRDPTSWPTIYVFFTLERALSVIDSARLLEDTDALRPVRQECGLMCGAGNLAQNYPARHVGVRVRLAPRIKLQLPSGAELFPGVAEDKFLRRLVDMQETSETNCDPYPVYQVIG
jgi:hypothetical protein